MYKNLEICLNSFGVFIPKLFWFCCFEKERKGFVQKKIRRASRASPTNPAREASLASPATTQHSQSRASPLFFLPLSLTRRAHASAPTRSSPSFFLFPNSRVAGDGASTFNVDDFLPFLPRCQGYKKPARPPSISPASPSPSCPQAGEITRRSSPFLPPLLPDSGEPRDPRALLLLPIPYTLSGASTDAFLFCFPSAGRRR